ncbi:MAG: AEC family transporter [Lachnospiraceae bacterium]|nr:AEC family transporter [Lachnospiraceae bacterium]
MSMNLVFSQILIILTYVLIGYIAGKAGLIGKEQRVFLSKLCADLILPFTVISATSQELDTNDVRNLLIGTALTLAVFLGVTFVSVFAHRLAGADRARMSVITGLVTYPNCTFLGLPLCLALFGDIAILYSAVMIIVFNVLFFTLQYTLFLKDKPSIRNLCTPTMISTLLMLFMLALKLRFPAPLQTAFSSIGSIISPLSLIIIGVMLSENRLLRILTEKSSYAVVFVRNLLIPLLVILLLKPLPLDTTSKMCLLVYLGCPCATLTSIYAMRLDIEPVLCVNSVLLSTLFFTLTLPLIILIGQFLL